MDDKSQTTEARRLCHQSCDNPACAGSCLAFDVQEGMRPIKTTSEYPVNLTDIVSAAIAAHKRTSAALAEPGATQAAAEAIRSLVERYADGR